MMVTAARFRTGGRRRQAGTLARRGIGYGRPRHRPPPLPVSGRHGLHPARRRERHRRGARGLHGHRGHPRVARAAERLRLRQTGARRRARPRPGRWKGIAGERRVTEVNVARLGMRASWACAST
ncbi:MAG: hypothetical protein MZU95_04770 [Desulfomicrobium escambiense]|nr:hypothetical protein [Desulfomicrobium escambiense]